MNKLKAVALALTTCFSMGLNANAADDKKEITYPRLGANLELGFIGVIDHRLQFSKDNTYFDYRKDGGQDVLFDISKYSLDLDLDPTHSLVFLYQPLRLENKNTLKEDMKQDNITFAKGTPMNFLYNFPFFRASYLYDFNKDPFEQLAIGASLQIRNATIAFESLDGKQLVSNRDIGPVPIIKFRSRHRLGKHWWFGSEIDGFYAPVSYLNGNTNDVIGAILDANFRIGANLSDRYYPYLNLRYIGGGAVGTSNNPDNLSGDGFTNNWINTIAVTLGMTTYLF